MTDKKKTKKEDPVETMKGILAEMRTERQLNEAVLAQINSKLAAAEKKLLEARTERNKSGEARRVLVESTIPEAMASLEEYFQNAEMAVKAVAINPLDPDDPETAFKLIEGLLGKVEGDDDSRERLLKILVRFDTLFTEKVEVEAAPESHEDPEVIEIPDIPQDVEDTTIMSEESVLPTRKGGPFGWLDWEKQDWADYFKGR